jgi:hypothetical protein
VSAVKAWAIWLSAGTAIGVVLGIVTAVILQ